MIAEYAWLCLMAALSGGFNALAGGGRLLMYPAMVALLSQHSSLSPDAAKIMANGTSTVALFPASLAALWGYRRDFATYGRWAALLVGPSCIGGTAGALLVTLLPESTFAFVVPWLILAAALLFAVQPLVARRLGIGKPHEAPDRKTLIGVVIFQFFIGVYGGYFGAAIGIFMLTALAMMGLSDIHAMNGLKNLLGACINGAAVVIFIVMKEVDWTAAALTSVAACIGAFLAAHYGRRLPATWIRWFITCIAFVLAAYYFYGQYARD